VSDHDQARSISTSSGTVGTRSEPDKDSQGKDLVACTCTVPIKAIYENGSNSSVSNLESSTIFLLYEYRRVRTFGISTIKCQLVSDHDQARSISASSDAIVTRSEPENDSQGKDLAACTGTVPALKAMARTRPYRIWSHPQEFFSTDSTVEGFGPSAFSKMSVHKSEPSSLIIQTMMGRLFVLSSTRGHNKSQRTNLFSRTSMSSQIAP
jgi:hypothetical protein